MVLSGSPATFMEAVNNAVDIEESVMDPEAPVHQTTAFGRYSPCVRSLQPLRSAATVPAFGRYSTYIRPLKCPPRTDSPHRGDQNKSDHVKNRATAAVGGGDGRSAAA
ncbi:sacsin [Dorcoceras hygrometricum]|uniref:Sacsin n=1 Tax=Dorcoceras hygrometricum TaxID=472368 RepID=A0A2Z7D8T0_9LAMI|nr:sacsin [Dorcoceras hygrometricum]